MSAALALSGVVKTYGAARALDGLALSIPRGSVCGLVGPNGAGKTTTFGVVGGLLRPDAGVVDILGAGPFDPAVHRGRVTLLPQDCALSPHTPVGELLRFYARLQGLGRARAAREAERVLELVSLSDRAGAKIRQLSHGMRRRVAVAQAFLGEPELVLLDEPTSGLDPDLVASMRALFQSQRGRATLVISSHLLAELEATCDHVIFLERGRCTRAGPMHEVTGRRRAARIRIEGAAPLDALREALPGATIRVEGDEIVIAAPPGLALTALNRAALGALLAAGVGVVEVRAGQSLEATWLARER